MHILSAKVLLFLSLTFSCFSEEIFFSNNNGGLNTEGSPIAIKDNESPDLLNINLDFSGGISKRNGYTRLNSTALPDSIDGMADYVLVAGTQFMVAAAAGMYKMDAFDGTWDDITGSTSIAGGNPMRFKVFENAIVGTNGVDKVQVWTGTSTASDSDVNSDISLTKAKYIESYAERLFFANVTVSSTDYPSRLYYSAIDDKDAWTAADFVRIGSDDGDVITGLIALGGYLYVTKKKSIFRVRATGDSTTPFTIQKTFADVGNVSPDSLQVVRNNLVFLSLEGLAAFDGNKSIILSERIRPTMDAFTQSILFLAKSTVFRKLNQYWLCLADEGNPTNDRVIIWDYKNNAFLRHDNIHANSILSIVDSNDVERLYTGDFAGWAYRQDQGSDDYPINVKTAIDGYYATKHFDLGSYTREKLVRHMVVMFEVEDNPSFLNVDFAFNMSDENTQNEIVDIYAGGATWDSPDIIDSWDVGTWPIIGSFFRRMDLATKCLTIRARFSNDTLTQQFNVSAFGIEYQPGNVILNQ